MKIVSVIGARPQFIKAAPFSAAFRRHHMEILVHTGQHYDHNMSDLFFGELGIPTPDYSLGVGSGSHGWQTGQMLCRIEEVLLKEKPDGLLVYGDTNSTLAGALAACKLHVPVFHVEAGLRSNNKRMPEEQNRVLTDHISDLLFCPTETAANNLCREGISSGVVVSGDIMFDAVLENIEIARTRYSISANIEKDGSSALTKLEREAYYLVTIHRAENTDDPRRLNNIFTALAQFDKPVIMPLHPRTRHAIREHGIEPRNVTTVDPVGYLLMLYLVDNAYMVMTDSGGLQKEAYFLRTPCTTIREETEWVETLDNGWNVLCSADAEKMIQAANRRCDYSHQSQSLAFGDGRAVDKIIKAIVDFAGC